MSTRVCSICKKELLIELFTPGEGRCRACNNARQRVLVRTLKGRYTTSRHIAKRRNLEWSIDPEAYAILVNQPCFYCGGPLNETGTGLDRIDNSLGYSPDNVLPCCRSCNRVKGDDFTFAEMQLLAEVIRHIKSSRLKKDISE